MILVMTCHAIYKGIYRSEKLFQKQITEKSYHVLCKLALKSNVKFKADSKMTCEMNYTKINLSSKDLSFCEKCKYSLVRC